MTGCENAAGVSHEAIRGALVRVTSSEQFRGSRRLQRFLTYIVEKTIDGALHEIKEYNIALTVFDREASFDARNDTIVRVEARRLRQQLSAYYEQGDGRQDPVIIELSRRGYTPVFRERSPAVPPTAAPRSSLRRFGYPVSLAVCGVVILVLSWDSGVFSYGRIPHSWDLQGSRLRILDSRERLCWERRFPQLGPQFAAAEGDKVLIEDIDNDGHKEVLVNVVPERNGDHAGFLQCLDDRGRPRWEFRYGAPKKFAGRSFDQSYSGRFLRLAKVHGKLRLVAVANHYLWYPAQVTLLDPANGTLLGEYWHPGSIHHAVLFDLDRDGVDELLFGAINNPGEGLGHAAVGVLKLPFSQPTPPRGFAGGGEFRYLLFPRPDINSVSGTFPFVARLGVDQDQRILVQVASAENGAVVYYLDRTLRVLETHITDNLRPLHARLANQRLLDHAFSEAELAGYARVMSFDAAPDGNSIRE